MKRDLDLVRAILKRIEECDDPDGLGVVQLFWESSKGEIEYHLCLMHQAGLITANRRDLFGFEGRAWRNINLTWDGHEFLRLTEDDTVWKKAKDVVIRPGVSFTFSILKEWLKIEALRRLGGG